MHSISQAHQAYLDSALRDIIEFFGHQWSLDRTQIPPELRAIIHSNVGFDEGDDPIEDQYYSMGAKNIWMDGKRAFRDAMLRHGLNPEAADELKLINLEPLKPLGSYQITATGTATEIRCEEVGLFATAPSLEAAIEGLYHAIREHYLGDEFYRPELDHRNWKKQPEPTSAQQAALKTILDQLK